MNYFGMQNTDTSNDMNENEFFIRYAASCKHVDIVYEKYSVMTHMSICRFDAFEDWMKVYRIGR